MEKTRRKYDIAYGCFTFSGVVALSIGGLSFVRMNSGSAGMMGFLIFIPLSIAALAAMLAGIGYTISLYRHAPLVVLSLFSILLLAEVVTEYGSTKFYNIVPIVYGLSTGVFSCTWLLVFRKRWGPNA